MQHRTVSSRHFRRAFSFVAVVGVAVMGSACSDSGNTAPLVASNIVVGTGSNAQTGVVGQALATPISVTITDQNGAPISNAVVGWTVGATDGTVSLPTSQTDANGNASIIWTLGTTRGSRFAHRGASDRRIDDDHRDGGGGWAGDALDRQW